MRFSPPADFKLHEWKIFSTFECSCINDDHSPADTCRDCWEWELLDLTESIRPWFNRTIDSMFVADNTVTRHWDGVFTRDTKEILVSTPYELIEYLIGEGDDFTILYKPTTPDDIAWHFWQFSPWHRGPKGQEWQPCRVFPRRLGDQFLDTQEWVDGRLNELAKADPFFASFAINEGKEST
jgi:hypothetical protein